MTLRAAGVTANQRSALDAATDLSATNAVVSEDGITAEVYDDFTQAPLGNFTARVADDGGAYRIAHSSDPLGNTTPTIESVGGKKFLSMANASAGADRAFYLERTLTDPVRFAFAKVMFGSAGSTGGGAVSLATPTEPIADSTIDGTEDIGIHCVFASSGAWEATVWENLVSDNTGDSGSLLGNATPPPTDGVTERWCGFVLHEDGTLVLLTPGGDIVSTKDARYLTLTNEHVWIEPYMFAGATDRKPYVSEWHAGSTIQEAEKYFASEGRVLDLIRQAIRPLDKAVLLGGANGADAATIADTTETDLHSYTVPGNTLRATGDRMVFKASGNTSANANTKRIRPYVAGTVVLDSTASALNAIPFHIEVNVIRTGATTARVEALGHFVGVASILTHTDLTGLTFTAPIVMKVTGLNGSAVANEIVLRTSSWDAARGT